MKTMVVDVNQTSRFLLMMLCQQKKILYLRSSREPINGIALCGKKTSDEVIVCIEFEDGTRKTTVAKTHDGIWKLDTRILKMKVTHWMPLPELPKEEIND